MLPQEQFATIAEFGIHLVIGGAFITCGIVGMRRERRESRKQSLRTKFFLLVGPFIMLVAVVMLLEKLNQHRG